MNPFPSLKLRLLYTLSNDHKYLNRVARFAWPAMSSVTFSLKTIKGKVRAKETDECCAQISSHIEESSLISVTTGSILHSHRREHLIRVMQPSLATVSTWSLFFTQQFLLPVFQPKAGEGQE